LSYHGWDKVILSVYRLGVLGDFSLEADTYGSADRQYEDEDGDLVTMPAPRLSWWWFQLVLFFGISFLLTVAMMNIFIQVMGSAFDRQEEIAEARFFRSRASICLSYSLRPWTRAAFLEEEFVWMCYQDRPNEERQARSVRQSMARACARLGRHLDWRLDHIDKRQEALGRRLEELGESHLALFHHHPDQECSEQDQIQQGVASDMESMERLQKVETTIGRLETQLAAIAAAVIPNSVHGSPS